MSRIGIITYALSSGFRLKVEELVGGSLEYVPIKDLSKLPMKQLIRRLVHLKPDELYLINEDEKGFALLPILRALTLLTRARLRFEIAPDLRIHRINFRSGLQAFYQFLLSTALCWLAAGGASVQTRFLMKRRRSPKIWREIGDLGPVLFLKTNFAFGVVAGGTIGHVAGVVNEMARRGMSVDFASWEKQNVLQKTVRQITLPHPDSYGLPMELNVCRLQFACASAFRPDFNVSYRFIYQRHSIGNYAGVVLSRRWKIPLILEYNGPEVWMRQHWDTPLKLHKLILRAEQVALRHADLVVTVSEASRQELIQRGVADERIVWYPNCVDPVIFDPIRWRSESMAVRRSHDIPRNALVVGFLGTFARWHGIDVLANAVRFLVDEHNEWLINNNIYFALVGNGLMMNSVLDLLGEAKYRRFVRLPGIVDQKDGPKYLEAMDIVLSPHVPNPDGSRFFGSPTKLFEYMAMGKAIIASNLEQIGDILQPSLDVTTLSQQPESRVSGALGILCRPGNVADLVTALRFLVANPEVRVRLGVSARKEALSKYCWEHHVNEIFWKASLLNIESSRLPAGACS